MTGASATFLPSVSNATSCKMSILIHEMKPSLLGFGNYK